MRGSTRRGVTTPAYSATTSTRRGCLGGHPASPHRLAEAGDRLRTIVVVCDEGYASSLAAASLQDLGLVNATDLEGGYQAWKRLG